MSISAVHTHPIEFILGNMIPMLSSLIILKSKMHFITLNAWVLMRVIETKDAHCGFEFPFSMFKAIPMNVGAAFHNFHHLKNTGNYATFTRIWDGMFGTDAAYRKQVLENENKRKEKKE